MAGEPPLLRVKNAVIEPLPLTVRSWLVRIIALLVFVGVWWVVSGLRLIDETFLPTPKAVWDAAVRASTWHQVAPGVPREVLGEQNYFLWEHLVASLQRIFAGVGAAIIVGPLLGFAMGTSKTVNTIIEPYLNFLRALPPLGYIGLLIVWFGIGDTSKIWLLFLAAFPAIAISTVNGVQGVSQDQINAARALGANRLQTIRGVIVPATLPEVINGIRIAVGFAWTTVVAAELNNGIPGIGGLAYLAGQQLNTPLTIACIIVIGVTALLLDSLIKWIGLLAVPWKGKA
ncbi:ABC transporter permease [Tsukamurella pulmonis]|uniref:Taurine transport system permease protein n=1 Tax=Tsukamurella pulmonis TaxID=47312 RepID=A0A1H1CSV4_9ACTN|nr:ABC transporter permease [Tsukamurella pulmonis]KXO89796.1 taurine ABC transporter permease [Tsukamurella pulmonis]KXP11051.1 taurine ABC transporter permease [Tsukamurella pulmonis]RDH11107.1 ABC transporter permease [Tsukamurella pulmonis]SDQ66636.1 taurine transport system permease protein [Tsukamurella pulmonis]SUP23282.1 Bicarbonate transport system permease protein CmpB [Tsukamurella pulmonis]